MCSSDLAGVGFFDTVLDSSVTPAQQIDNRSSYHDAFVFPFGNAGLELGTGGTVVVTFVQQIPTAGFIDLNVSFGGFSQQFVESEIFLQALTLDGTGVGEISNRLQVDFN